GLFKTGAQLDFVASLSDDDVLLQQNIGWVHTLPNNTTLPNQGTINPNTPSTTAQLSYTADLSTAGQHKVQVSYNDGTNAPATLSLLVNVVDDLPATGNF